MTVHIGPATRAHLPAMLDLLKQNGLPPDGLESHIETTLVAVEDGRLVGSAALELYQGSALLRSVAVDAPRRGTGLGHRLTLAALDLARRRGVKSVYLLTETAADFFPRFGFKPVPRESVEPAVQQSVEFTKACPASALAMKRELP
jgi:amino-acid N-acetyltransferase